MDTTNELQNGNMVDEEIQYGKVLDNVSQPNTVIALEDTEPVGGNKIINYTDVLTCPNSDHGNIEDDGSIKASAPVGNNFLVQETVGSSQQGEQGLSTELEPWVEKVSDHGLWCNV